VGTDYVYKISRFSLMPANAQDEATVLRWRNSPRIQMWMRNGQPISADEHAIWFQAALSDVPPTRYLLHGETAPLGFVHFRRLVGAEWEWSLYVGEPSAPRGSGTALGILGLDAALGKLGATHVYSSALLGNERAIRLYERLGFEPIAGSNVARNSHISCDRERHFRISSEGWHQKRAEIKSAFTQWCL
jgi:UDP-4-amino-4,6-dideoxy-N-acetyl-beta-L-altrosamine N-acetyltransferase